MTIEETIKNLEKYNYIFSREEANQIAVWLRELMQMRYNNAKSDPLTDKTVFESGKTLDNISEFSVSYSHLVGNQNFIGRKYFYNEGEAIEEFNRCLDNEQVDIATLYDRDGNIIQFYTRGYCC